MSSTSIFSSANTRGGATDTAATIFAVFRLQPAVRLAEPIEAVAPVAIQLQLTTRMTVLPFRRGKRPSTAIPFNSSKHSSAILLENLLIHFGLAHVILPDHILVHMPVAGFGQGARCRVLNLKASQLARDEHARSQKEVGDSASWSS